MNLIPIAIAIAALEIIAVLAGDICIHALSLHKVYTLSPDIDGDIDNRISINALELSLDRYRFSESYRSAFTHPPTYLHHIEMRKSYVMDTFILFRFIFIYLYHHAK